MTAYVSAIVSYILRFIQLTLFIRALLSWFPMNRGGKLFELLYFFTEPFLMPVRKFLFRFPSLRQFPIDFSTIIVYLIIEILLSFL